ncbi:NACHT domain-containing protein [Streptomyces iconiensis]|uniref:NACHT domain-containing protein n=1 Tax=Streptomyces iconiensis TaxID=1384038 RepID=A0ABT7A9M8_9ACTN|nr:NACHT domain-containing protein [Streptomyces iconiensis]MDJ1138029.1 NACHT domain-containing protein [Streptomyces iconiensis]
MDAGIVGARIASSVVAPLVKRLFVTEGPGAGLVDRPVRVSGLVSFTGEKRTLTARDLERIAEEVVRRTVADMGPHEAPSPGERERVTVRLSLALQALGEIGLSDVEAVQLGHTDFARALHAQATQATTGQMPLDPTPGESGLYQRALDTACLHILHFFTQRSTFVARTLVEQSRRLGELITLVDVLIKRVPSQSAQDAGFEQQYARYIANKHCKLTIYGVDLQQASQWPLDTAYLSLEAAPAAVHLPDSLGRQHTAEPQPVEQALSGHERILLRGIAGSGKTTLVQWLAVTTARQAELTGRLAHLIGRVPFVLPLRTLTRGGARLPVPSDFLSAVGCPLAGAQPLGWVERVLTAGRGVLLVDGIDEVPEDEREHTRRWLADLLSAFSGNLVLVTSRPSAVREDWLGGDDFTELSLSPMRPTDVDVFIHRWHAAAEAGGELEGDLRTAVRAQADLGRLATNPLMCGLICALHRERRGFLPRGRKALYDAALSMLLERRDRERAMHSHPDAIELDEESQIELLQRIAYWLIRNGRSEMTHTDALDLLTRALPAMPYVAGQGTAEEVFRYLLVRSGLLREPAHGAVEFVHRTFQDYLGAKAAVEERDFDLLTRHAHLDQWEDVLRMAVAHARPDERARLLRTLIERGDKEPDVRARLHLLAMACLEHATRLDPEVRTAVEDRARALIPPRSIDEAKQLAQVGPVVLELLPGPEGLEDDEAQAVTHTVAQLGSEAALTALVRFRDHPSDNVIHQLGGHWDRFDTDAYADDIVSHLVHRQDALIVVRTREELARWSALGGSERVRLNGDFTPKEILDAVPPDKVRMLGLARNPGLTDLGFLAAFPHLSELHFYDCTALRDLSPLEALPLKNLQLEHVPLLAELGALNGLEVLHLNRGAPWLGWDALPSAEGLAELRLPADTGALSGLAAYPGLSTLGLGGGLLFEPWTANHWGPVATHPALRFLTLAHATLHSMNPGSTPAPGLTTLQLVGGEGLLGHGPELFPSLTHLMLNDPDVDFPLLPFTTLPHLTHISLFRPESYAHLPRIPSHIEVRTFPRPR